MNIVGYIILFAAILSGLYIVKAHNPWEMLLGYSSLTVKLIALMILFSVIIGAEWAIDAAIAYMMLSIGGLMILAYFNSRRS
ncbi:hypothetical protein GM182_02815 [bacterium 3DAC]|jgi:NADH-quinone oxidoreductase subunit J|nr:hypothetical protein [Dictyoglomota bacterium]UZN22855.1 hypothetical protein GM182_02815 [bacterium 3DAC]